MMDSGYGVFCPPEGLTTEEQARWWLSEPVMFMMAVNNGSIPSNVMAAIEETTKDHGHAFKIIDEKRVRGLTNEERSRLFYILTNGGEWSGRKQGASTKTLQNLRLAYATREISDLNTRRDMLSDAILKQSGGMISKDGIYRRIRRIDQLWQSVCHYKPGVIACIVNSCPEDDISITEDTIHWMAGLLNAFNELPDDEMRLLSSWLEKMSSQSDH